MESPSVVVLASVLLVLFIAQLALVIYLPYFLSVRAPPSPPLAGSRGGGWGGGAARGCRCGGSGGCCSGGGCGGGEVVDEKGVLHPHRVVADRGVAAHDGTLHDLRRGGRRHVRGRRGCLRYDCLERYRIE